MKDGRTHLAHKAEHAVDLDTGAMVAVTLQGRTTATRRVSSTPSIAAIEQAAAAQAGRRRPQALTEIVADKGYHSNQTMVDFDAVGVRSYVAEPDRGPARVDDGPGRATGRCTAIAGGCAAARGQRLLRRRGEYVERSFAHVYDTGGMRRTHLRGQRNILKRLLVHAGAFNLGLLMRQLFGRGTPRGLQGRRLDARSLHVALLMLSARLWMTIGALLAHCRRPPRVLHPHPAWAIA